MDGNGRWRSVVVNTDCYRPLPPITASCARFDPVLIQPRPMLESPLRRLSIMTCGIRFLPRLPSLVVGAALVLACCPTSLAAQAQATTGVIRGTVSDPSGNVVVGALVTLTDIQTRFQRTVTTNEKGVFVAPLLPLGTYEVRARAVGLGERRQTGIVLRVGETVDLALKLEPVELAAVTVTATPVVDVSKVESSTRLPNQVVAGLPNNGRNFLNLTLLTPNVATVQGPDGDELTVAGQRGIHNNVSVDGADFNNPFFGEQRGGQRPPFTFNLDAVKELVVVADGANAEFGRSMSGFVNVITKSGTNDNAGTAHVTFKNDSLSSQPKNPDGTTSPKFSSTQTQTGFTLGGPIQRDRLFYFGALDLQKASSTKQTDPNRIEQRVVDAYAGLGSPNENGPIHRTNDARVLLLKADYSVSAKNLANLRYNYTWSEQENGTFDVDSWGRSANAIERDSSHALIGGLTSTLTQSVLNEFRFQAARENRPRPYNGPNITGQSRPLPDTASPERPFTDPLGPGRGYRFGEPFFIPVKYYDTRVQFNDNVSLLRGAHSYKAGVEYNRVNSVQTFVGFANGRWIFDSTGGFLNY